ncbi:hypothetical protein [Rhizobium phage RHph_N46]|nr:hypothetical protein [Rhizobium phage RHph_N46]
MSALPYASALILLTSSSPRTYLEDLSVFSEKGVLLGETTIAARDKLAEMKDFVLWRDTEDSPTYVTLKQNKKLIKRLRKVEEVFPLGWEAFDSKQFTFMTAAGKNPSKFLTALIPDQFKSAFDVKKDAFVHNADDSGMRIRLAVRNGGSAVLFALVLTEDNKAARAMAIAEAFAYIADEVAASDARIAAKKEAKRTAKAKAAANGKADLKKAA